MVWVGLGASPFYNGHMKVKAPRAGGWGWVGLAVYIAAVDAWLIRTGRATLSEVFGCSLRHPLKRLPVMTVWVVITAHLFAELLPQALRSRFKNYDPIGWLARKIEAGVDKVSEA